VKFKSPEEVQRAYEALTQAVTYVQRINSNQATEQDDDDDEIGAPGMFDAHVQLALRLMGHFQPAEQAIAFSALVNSAEPAAFPSALRDIMGWTLSFK
jgi:hypothetical protein